MKETGGNQYCMSVSKLFLIGLRSAWVLNGGATSTAACIIPAMILCIDLDAKAVVTNSDSFRCMANSSTLEPWTLPLHTSVE